MTQDHLDDFSALLDKEGASYLIAIMHPNGKGVHLRTELANWPVPKLGHTKEEDCLHAIAVAVASTIGEPVLVINDQKRLAILGALDDMAVKLARYNHTWTEGERALYEDALKYLGVKPESQEEEPA